MLKIWGNADSVTVQKVLWCCEELHLAYQRIDAGRHFDVVDTPAFRKLNPHGLVPTIDDDGFAVWESNAIVLPLPDARCGHAAGTLWPTAPKPRGDADRWMDWANSTLWLTLVPGHHAHPRSAARRARDRRRTAAEFCLLQVLDGHRASSNFVGCAVWRWMALPVERPALSNLQRWFDAPQARQAPRRNAYRTVVMLPLT